MTSIFERHGLSIREIDARSAYSMSIEMDDLSGNNVSHRLHVVGRANGCAGSWLVRVRGYAHRGRMFTIDFPWKGDITEDMLEVAFRAWREDSVTQRFLRGCYATESAGVELDPNDPIEHADRLPGFAHEFEALLVRYGYTSSQDVIRVRARDE